MTISMAIHNRPSFQGVRYPAQKHDLLAQAQNCGVGDDVLSFISAMPDQEYRTPAELRQAILTTLPTGYSSSDCLQ